MGVYIYILMCIWVYKEGIKFTNVIDLQIHGIFI